MRRVDNEPQITRRNFLKGGAAMVASIFLGPSKDKKTEGKLPPEDFTESAKLREYAEVYKASAEKNRIEYPSGERVIIPSSAYKGGIYGRDSFFSVMGLNDAEMCTCCYREFEKAQDSRTGQIPTQVLFNKEDKSEKWQDDETTLLFLIWSGVVNDRGERVNREKIEKAFGFVQKHVRDGQYQSEPGSFRYWADTLINPQKQVITYNQGLYACVMQVMYKNNWGEVTLDEVEKAKEEYRGIWRQNYKKGYLPQAEGQEIIDLSALFPEVLSRYFFNEPILPDKAVLTTIDYALEKAKVDKWTGGLQGIKIIFGEDGEFLPEKAFCVPSLAGKGDYQNGGYWPMWTLVDLALAYKISKKEEYRQMIVDLLAVEFEKNKSSKEYICLSERERGYTNPDRDHYSWNVFFNPIARWAGLNR